jgi:hypothetical protein
MEREVHALNLQCIWNKLPYCQVRLYSRPDVVQQLAYAASIAVDIHKWLQTETGIDYPLQKMG